MMKGPQQDETTLTDLPTIPTYRRRPLRFSLRLAVFCYALSFAAHASVLAWLAVTPTNAAAPRSAEQSDMPDGERRAVTVTLTMKMSDFAQPGQSKPSDRIAPPSDTAPTDQSDEASDKADDAPKNKPPIEPVPDESQLTKAQRAEAQSPEAQSAEANPAPHNEPPTPQPLTEQIEPIEQIASADASTAPEPIATPESDQVAQADPPTAPTPTDPPIDATDPPTTPDQTALAELPPEVLDHLPAVVAALIKPIAPALPTQQTAQANEPAEPDQSPAKPTKQNEPAKPAKSNEPSHTATAPPTSQQADPAAVPDAPQIVEADAPAPTPPPASPPTQPAVTDADNPAPPAVVYDEESVDQPIAFKHLARPEPSSVSRRLGDTGTIRILVEVDTDGTLLRHKVIDDADQPRLLAAALDALDDSSFHPAEREGTPVRSTRVIEYRF